MTMNDVLRDKYEIFLRDNAVLEKKAWPDIWNTIHPVFKMS